MLAFDKSFLMFCFFVHSFSHLATGLKIRYQHKKILSGISSSITSLNGAIPDFSVIGEDLVYNGWRKVIRRDVLMPNGRKTSFDINSQGAPSTVVFIWNTNSNTTTLLKEYYPGTNEVMYGCVGGVYEKSKHESLLVKMLPIP